MIPDMRLIFFGTPDFAVPSLMALCQMEDVEVVAVVTQPDRPAGRGKRRKKPPPVKEKALELGLPVLQREDINQDEAIEKLQSMRAQVFFVVAFGQLLGRELLSLPAYGCINLHASLLPLFRGAAPIQWAIIQGCKETGVTTILLDEGMDSGDILLQKRISIGSQETAGQLHDRLAAMGAVLLLRTLSSLKGGSLVQIPQDEDLVTFAPRLTARDSLIHWSHSALDIHNLIRGTNPSPGAYTVHRCGRVKIWRSHLVNRETDAPPGQILCAEVGALYCATGEGVLALDLLQPAGRKKMQGSDYLHGYCLLKGDSFLEAP